MTAAKHEDARPGTEHFGQVSADGHRSIHAIGPRQKRLAGLAGLPTATVIMSSYKQSATWTHFSQFAMTATAWDELLY
jgi:hypothetical protein